MIKLITSPTQGGSWLLIPTTKNGKKREPFNISWQEVQQLYRATNKIMGRGPYKPRKESHFVI